MNWKLGIARIWLFALLLYEAFCLVYAGVWAYTYMDDKARGFVDSTAFDNVLVGILFAAIGVAAYFVGRWIARGFLSD